MQELVSPFVRLWTYIGHAGGFPGQVFFCCGIVLLIIGVLTWIGNRK